MRSKIASHSAICFTQEHPDKLRGQWPHWQTCEDLLRGRPVVVEDEGGGPGEPPPDPRPPVRSPQYSGTLAASTCLPSWDGWIRRCRVSASKQQLHNSLTSPSRQIHSSFTTAKQQLHSSTLTAASQQPLGSTAAKHQPHGSTQQPHDSLHDSVTAASQQPNTSLTAASQHPHGSVTAASQPLPETPQHTSAKQDATQHTWRVCECPQCSHSQT